MLSGDNGILQKSTDAKTETEKGQESEIVALAYSSALAKKVGNGDSTEVTSEDINAELTNQGATAAGSSPIKVTFTTSKRQYTINNGIVDYAGIQNDDPSGDGLEGLSSEEFALLPTGVTEKSIENISNENLKDVTKIKAVITDSDKGEVPIPKSANYREGTESTGLVITYKGSEFVWIPVNSDLTVKGTSKLMAKVSTGSYAGTDDNGRTNYEGVLYDDSLNVRTGYGQSTTSNREPSDLQGTTGDWSLDSDRGLALIKKHITGMSGKTNDEIKTEWAKQLQKEYNAMIESIQKYGGFYVGRYESSLNGNSAKSVSGVKPMSASATEGDTWYGLYQKQKNFTTSSDSMVASMIWGSQYDAMLNWAKDSGTTTGSHVTQKGYGNHQGSSVGAVECGSYNNGRDIINNIYDLEGNLLEWTLESDRTNLRVSRGGDYTDRDTPAYHFSCSPFDTYAGNGSRLSLYVR